MRTKTKEDHPEIINMVQMKKNNDDCGIWAVNRMAAIDAHERQVFEKLLWGLVSSTIFVRC
jgi:hypothetical protein